MIPAANYPQLWLQRWQRLSEAAVRAFHRYANWLVGISWRKFFVLGLLLIILANILQSLPPFTWRITETIESIDDAGEVSTAYAETVGDIQSFILNPAAPLPSGPPPIPAPAKRGR